MSELKNELQEELGSARDIYTSLETYRSSLEQTWQDCSELTLPYVFPDDDLDESQQLSTPFNSIGPSAVNALASKLLLALLPPTGNFFRLLPNEEDIQGLDKEARDMLDTELGKLEQDVNMLVNAQALRVPLFEALKLLIITGNSLVYKIPSKGIKVFNPYQYVVQRDFVGNIVNIAIKEKVAKRTLPKSVIKLIDKDADEDTKCKKDIKVYTLIALESKDVYKSYQEINGIVIPGTEKTYSKEELPYLPLRWTSMANEDYGRGLVEQYLGDLRSLEGLTQLIVEGGGIMSKTIFGLKPASTTKIEDLNNAKNGDFILGDLEKDITVLQTGKAADMQVPFELIQQLEQRLSKAFLVFSSQVRDSERTTASEVRLVANELEATLGGTFSVLAQDLQLPLLTLILNEIEPKVLKVTTPAISTGIDAISRERDFQNLNTMAQTLAQFGPETIQTYMNLPKYFSKIATSLGMDATDIVKTTEQIQAEQQQMAMAQQQQAQQEQQMQMQQIEAKQGGN